MRAIVVTSVLMVVAGPARADAPTPEQRAKAHELGEAALRRLEDNSSDFAGASELFQKAYDISHELPYLINVAVTQRKGKLPQQAIAAYRRCLAEGGDQLTPDMRTRIEADIQSVTAESGQVRVRTEGAPAEVLLDDRIAGMASADAPLLVVVAPDAGLIHKLRARRALYRDGVASIETLSIGTPTDVTLTLTLIPTTATLTIESVPTGAELRGLGTAPLTVTVPPGDHTVWATLAGHERAVQTVHVEAGETRKLTLALRRIPPSWWDEHKWQVLIGAGVVAVAAGAIVTRQLLEPDYGHRFDYP